MPRVRARNNKQVGSANPLLMPRQCILKLDRDKPTMQSFHGLFVKVTNIIFNSMVFYLKDKVYYAFVARRSYIKLNTLRDKGWQVIKTTKAEVDNWLKQSQIQSLGSIQNLNEPYDQLQKMKDQLKSFLVGNNTENLLEISNYINSFKVKLDYQDQKRENLSSLRIRGKFSQPNILQ